MIVTRARRLRSIQALPYHFVILPVLILAAFLRLAPLGEQYMDGDHAYISIRALHIAHYGDRPLLGPPMAIGLWHSPLSVYLFAIPYRFSLNPLVARAFSAGMGIVTVGLIYGFGARYFDRKAGAVAALLYAVHPFVLTSSGLINNAQLGAPFVMLFLITGLYGYWEGQRWAQLLHLPLLSIAGQLHPHSYSLAPIPILLFVIAWRKWPAQRKGVALRFTIGAAVALALLIPWLIGLYQLFQSTTIADVLSVAARGTSLERAFQIWYSIFSANVMRPPNLISPLHPLLLAVGSLWLLARSTRLREELPAFITVLSFFLMPTLVLILNIHLVGDYFWPLLPAAFLIQGALIGGIQRPSEAANTENRFWNWRGLLNDPALRWVGYLLTGVLVAAHLSLFITLDRTLPGAIPLKAQIEAMETATVRARSTGKELLLLGSPGDDNFLPLELLREIEVLRSGMSVRAVQHGRALPLPSDGAVLLARAEYTGRPDIFSGGEIVAERFRIVELPAAESIAPDYLPLQPASFSNGAAVIGFRPEIADSLPHSDNVWTANMLWRTDQLSHEEYTLFAHLVDENGDKYAQADVPGLPVGQQRVGEYVISRMELRVGDNLPPDGPLFLRFGMYNESGSAQLLDHAGNPVGGFGQIQIRSDGEPLADWPNGLTLTRLQALNTQQQGPPIILETTWYAHESVQANAQVILQLHSPAGEVVFEQSARLIQETSIQEIPAKAFTTQHHELRIPSDIEPGSYQLELSVPLADAAGNTPTANIAIDIEPRQRVFAEPPIEHHSNATFGNLIELTGYDLSTTAGTLSLILHWHALSYIPEDFNFFVHVWNAGQVVAQIDSMPAQYNYPTSWWAPGEYFSDPVQVNIAALGPGNYSITAGLYNPVTGERLPVTHADGTPATNGWANLQELLLE